MIKQLSILAVFILLVSISSSCIGKPGKDSSSGDSDSSSSDSNLPIVALDCYEADSNNDDCESSDDGTNFVGYIYEDYDCSGSPGDGVAVTFVEADCDSTVCSGEIEQWYNDTSFDSDDEIDELDEGDYGMVFFLDLNDNNDIDSGEPYECQEITVSDDEEDYDFNSWEE